MSLGARTERDNDRRRTRLVLADMDTGTRLALTHDWRVPVEKAGDEAALRAAERVAPEVRLDQLAIGQLLSQQAKRLADGTIALARTRSTQNSLLPRSSGWALLTHPLRYARVVDLVEQRRLYPHPMTAPRHAAGQFLVFSPATIAHAIYDPTEQCIELLVHDADGGELIVRRSFESHVRHALEGFAAAINGLNGPIRHIAGVLSWRDDTPVIEPWTIACDGLIALDFYGHDAAASAALAQIPIGYGGDPKSTSLFTPLDELLNICGTLLHHGVTMLPTSWLIEARDVHARLRSMELTALATHWAHVIDLVRDMRVSPPHDAALAPRLGQLLCLRQLHVDAMAV